MDLTARARRTVGGGDEEDEMRFDDLPQSDNIEDRRGDWRRRRWRRLRHADGRPRRARHRHHRGARHHRLRARHRSAPADRRRRDALRRRRSSSSSRARPSGKTGAPSDDMGKFVSRILGSRRRAVEADLRAGRAALPRADARDVLRRDARRRVRAGAVRDGPVLLPGRPEDLSRHLVLPRPRAPLQAAATPARARASSRRPT